MEMLIYLNQNPGLNQKDSKDYNTYTLRRQCCVTIGLDLDLSLSIVLGLALVARSSYKPNFRSSLVIACARTRPNA